MKTLADWIETRLRRIRLHLLQIALRDADAVGNTATARRLGAEEALRRAELMDL